MKKVVKKEVEEGSGRRKWEKEVARKLLKFLLKYTGEVWIRGRKVVFLREILRAMAGRFNLRFRSDCLFSEIFEGGGTIIAF